MPRVRYKAMQANWWAVTMRVSGHTIRLRHAVSADDDFATLTQVVAADWVEAEQLFGCLRQFNGDITLQPGLVHQANGGILIISLRTLLAQPLLWMRLKISLTASVLTGLRLMSRALSPSLCLRCH